MGPLQVLVWVPFLFVSSSNETFVVLLTPVSNITALVEATVSVGQIWKGLEMMNFMKQDLVLGCKLCRYFDSIIVVLLMNFLNFGLFVGYPIFWIGRIRWLQFTWEFYHSEEWDSKVLRVIIWYLWLALWLFWEKLGMPHF